MPRKPEQRKTAAMPLIRRAAGFLLLGLAVFSAALTATAGAGHAQGGDGSRDSACTGGSDPPTPVTVEVSAVPIVADSTTADYFVLYVRHGSGDESLELPVLVKVGEAGTTTLAENVAALPVERYRVEKYAVTNPADVDGDCIDDITELGNPPTMSPVNAATDVFLTEGAVIIPDRDTFDTLATLQEVKFFLGDLDTDRPSVYFIDTNYCQIHICFVGVDVGRLPPRGGIIHAPDLVAPDGSLGVFYFYLREGLTSHHSFSLIDRVNTVLAANMPMLEGQLSLHLPNTVLPTIQSDLPSYRASRIPLLFDDDLHPGITFLGLNEGEAYGLLRALEPGDRPNPRDIVIYEALPNDLPRVAGIVSAVPQTPLSHINLRAVQDGVPNAFIRSAAEDSEFVSLLGSYVHYAVGEEEYAIRAATREEVDAHYAAVRPPATQTPHRDLSVTAIKALGDIGFEDWTAFGVKAANVAVLRTLGLPEGTVPDGFAIPFYFYDEFMKHNELYARITTMLADSDFQTDFQVQDDRLDNLRDAIKDAETPQWIITALTTMHASFPTGTSLRYRSSTNNEDLPGFNGAGLYDSKTQHPHETVEDGIDKSFKQVLASLWTFRAFTEREFHRIDHLAAAMGVLVHPNYSNELANGVAVSFDPIYGHEGSYYVNTQVGEDLVTNPEAHSTPEEILLREGQPAAYTILATSNQALQGQLLVSDAQLGQLRRHLGAIHDKFATLYGAKAGDQFAIEIEFKVTSENALAIKQARPWVFYDPLSTQGPVATPPRATIGGGGGGGGGPSGPSPSDVDFEWTVTHDIDDLAAGHDMPTGMWSDGATLWLAHNPDGPADAVYPYDLETGERLPEREFDLDERNRAPRGVWSDRTVIWVSDSGQEKLFAQDLTSGQRLEDRDIVLHEDNANARGIWSRDGIIWVLDGRADTLFAYELASGEYVGRFALDRRNSAPHGIWSDGVTVWVSDHGEKDLLAYRLPMIEAEGAPPGADLERVRDEDFKELSGASNNSPRGIWSDGDVMYVVDESDDKVYSYNMPDAIDARLASLSLSGVDIGEFDRNRTDYEGTPDEGATETTVTAEAMQRRTDVAIDPPDADVEANGHQVALQDLDEITVTVTSADGSRKRTYRVRFADAEQEATAEPWPHCLLGGVAIGFSLVVYEGGTVEELGACARSRNVVALYTLHEGAYVSYILGAPDFVNAGFRELYPNGVPAVAPLVAGSDGPPGDAPVPGGAVWASWPECLRGEIVEGFSLVVYEGGSVEDLVACARSRSVTALYALADGEWVSYISGAPEFANQEFTELFGEDVPPLTPLVAKIDESPSAYEDGN